ncbi:hypothetical protein [Sphingomonas sp. DC1100-1]|uniref:hypothetical protein n=1 Tax=unclassified Sphingomonas TaxID=196159 RepID=UPI003CED3BAA
MTRRDDAAGAAPADVGPSFPVTVHCASPCSLTLILAAEDDPILPIAGGHQLAALGRRGNAIRWCPLPYAGHDFNAAYEGIPNQTVRQMVGRFLAENDPGPAR